MRLIRAGGVRPQLWLLVVTAACVLSAATIQYYPIGGEMVIISKTTTKPFQFPSGGRMLFPNYRLVALYGTPDTPELGALGEQPQDAAIVRAKATAVTYQPLMAEHAYPCLEIIATVASSSPAGNYSYPINVTKLTQWVLAAKQEGVYVVLDLQPGRNDFLSQAKQLEPLLTQPNVGLALDPEWRLTPSQVPLRQIGSVGIDEVNQTDQWLASLTKQHHLPQKLFLLHEFMLTMLPNREQLDTTHPELAYAIQMDGQGGQSVKMDTWNAIRVDPPPNVHFGWKNFYKKDAPTRSPADTMLLDPQPRYISYQ